MRNTRGDTALFGSIPSRWLVLIAVMTVAGDGIGQERPKIDPSRLLIEVVSAEGKPVPHATLWVIDREDAFPVLEGRWYPKAQHPMELLQGVGRKYITGADGLISIVAPGKPGALFATKEGLGWNAQLLDVVNLPHMVLPLEPKVNIPIRVVGPKGTPRSDVGVRLVGIHQVGGTVLWTGASPLTSIMNPHMVAQFYGNPGLGTAFTAECSHSNMKDSRWLHHSGDAPKEVTLTLPPTGSLKVRVAVQPQDAETNSTKPSPSEALIAFALSIPQGLPPEMLLGPQAEIVLHQGNVVVRDVIDGIALLPLIALEGKVLVQIRDKETLTLRGAKVFTPPARAGEVQQAEIKLAPSAPVESRQLRARLIRSDGQPLKSIPVEFIAMHGEAPFQEPSAGTTVTDENGVAAIDLSISFPISAIRFSYRPAGENLLEATDMVPVKYAEVITGRHLGNLPLNPFKPLLSGKVTDSEGHPLAGAEVLLSAPWRDESEPGAAAGGGTKKSRGLAPSRLATTMQNGWLATTNKHGQ